MGDSNNGHFEEDVDRHVKEKIDEKLRQEPGYYTEKIDALEIMESLNSVIASPTPREYIERLYNNKGNTYAVRETIKQMQKFQNYGITFLKALVRTGHKNLAEELISGFRIDSLNHGSEASFIRGLLNVLPMSHDSSLSNEPFYDQQEKLNHYNSLRPTYSPDGSMLSSIHTNDISLSNPSTSLTTISPSLPPSYVSLNFSNPSSSQTQTVEPNTSSAANNEVVYDSAGSTMIHTIPEGDEVLSPQNGLRSDLHDSEMCVSGESTQVSEVTIPKEIITATRSQSTEIENGSERLDAIVPSTSPETFFSNTSTGSTQYEQEERVIADSTLNIKNYHEREAEIVESAASIRLTSFSDKHMTPKDYLWEAGVALLALISVAVFLVKRR